MNSIYDQDQNDQSNYNEQSVENESDEVQTEQSQSQKFSVAWKEVDASWLYDAFTKLQSEYTKSRQELSEIKKQEEANADPEVNNYLKTNWYVTKDDIQDMLIREKRQSELEKTISSNPVLEPYKNAIEKLANTENLSISEVIDQYGFWKDIKLSKAKAQGDIKWTPNLGRKAISQMTDKEYAEFKKQNGMWWFWTFSR